MFYPAAQADRRRAAATRASIRAAQGRPGYQDQAYDIRQEALALSRRIQSTTPAAEA